MSQEDPTDLVTQQKSAEARAQDARNRRDTDKADLEWLMATPRGRRIAWRLLEATGLYVSSFTGNSETFFREGKRAIGLEFQGKVAKAAPLGFQTMMQEHFGHD